MMVFDNATHFSSSNAADISPYNLLDLKMQHVR